MAYVIYKKSAIIKSDFIKAHKSNFLKIYIAKNFGRRDKSKWESEVLFHIKVSKDKKEGLVAYLEGLVPDKKV